MAEDLANSIVQAASLMENKQKTKPVAVLYRKKQGMLFLNDGSERKGDGEELGYSISYAYNHTVNQNYIPLDKADPANRIISQAFDCDPFGQKLVGVFTKPQTDGIPKNS